MLAAYIRRHHIALLALFIALGGTSYAALKLPRGSVGSPQLRSGAVTSAKVRDGTLRRKDFKAGQLRAGPVGPAGDRGATGSQGPAGPQGASGPQGPSGVVHVMNLEATWSPVTLNGNNGNTWVTPSACRTVAYTAGPGEAAFVSMSGTATPTTASNDVLYVSATVSVNGGLSWQTQSGVDQGESMSDGTANASTQDLIALQPGTSYRFGVGVSSNGMVPISTGYCTALVVIYRAL